MQTNMNVKMNVTNECENKRVVLNLSVRAAVPVSTTDSHWNTVWRCRAGETHTGLSSYLNLTDDLNTY